MSDRVTVAVVSWNTRDLLAACLRSLAPEADAGRADVWVVDNASSDGSSEMVGRDFPWARLIAKDRNVGFGAAVDEVAARTEGRWLVAANADVNVVPGALEQLIAAARAEPAAGAIAPMLVTPDGKPQHSVHGFPTLGLAALFALGLYRLPGVGDRLCIEGYWDPARPRRVDWAHAAFLLLRREAYDAVDGFDPAQWLYAEDIDLQWRLARAGWTTRYEPAARVGHAVGAATTQAFGDERTARHVAATYAWLARRRGRVVTWATALVNGAGAGARLLALAPLAAFAPRRFAAARDRARLFCALHLRGLRGRAALERAVKPRG